MPSSPPQSSISFWPGASWLTGASVLGMAASVEEGGTRFVAIVGALVSAAFGVVALSKEWRAWRRYLDHERHQCPITGGPCARGRAEAEEVDRDAPAD